jgi:hypothetical protein
MFISDDAACIVLNVHGDPHAVHAIKAQIAEGGCVIVDQVQ